MKRNSLIVIYLALSVLCLRVVGLHLHVHHHVAPHAATESEGVHLASDLKHDSTHQQVVDADILESGLIKKPGQSWEPNAFWVGVMALVLTLLWRPVRYRPRRQLEVFVSLLRYFQPPSLAPPRPAS